MTPGALAAAAAAVEVPPAVPEAQEPGTCSLLDADVAPHWPAKPGVYVRGAFTRQMGAQQLARMTGGTRCVSGATQLACEDPEACLYAVDVSAWMVLASVWICHHVWTAWHLQSGKGSLPDIWCGSLSAEYSFAVSGVSGPLPTCLQCAHSGGGH